MQNWDDLRILLAVADAGSIRGAGTALALNHATVSRRLKDFENRIGARLMARVGSGTYVATPAGEDLLTVARGMRDELGVVERRVTGRDAALTGTVRLTFSETIADLLAPALAAFGRAYPEIHLMLAEGNRQAAVGGREADVAVRFTATPPDDLVGRRMASVAVAPWASKLYAREIERRGGMAAARWIVPAPQFADMPHARWIAANVPPENIGMTADTFHIAQRMVASDYGVCLLPNFIGAAEPKLVRVGPNIPEAAMPLWVLTHNDLRETARIRALMDTLYTTIDENRVHLES